MLDSRKGSHEKTSAEVAEKPNHLANAIAKITGDLERNPEDVQQAIVQRVLQTESLDDVFAESSTISAEDVVGKPHLIKQVDFSKSRFEQGAPAFAIVTADFDNGETIYTIGATTALAQLIRLVDNGLPAPFKTVLKQKDQPTQQGYYPMFYVKA